MGVFGQNIKRIQYFTPRCVVRMTMEVVVLGPGNNDIFDVYLGADRQQAADGKNGHRTMLGEGCSILMDDEWHGVPERSRRSPTQMPMLFKHNLTMRTSTEPLPESLNACRIDAVQVSKPPRRHIV